MHPAAYDFVRRHATGDQVAVLDVGGRDVNGSPRPLFPGADPYRVVDIWPGDGVDLVVDAADWTPDRLYDVVVCTEVFEHTPLWPAICRTAFVALRPGGRLITTMAGPGRAPHSALDGGQLRDGEYYGNVDPAELAAALKAAGFVDVDVDQAGEDVRAVAARPA